LGRDPPKPETHPNPPCLGREPDTAESNNKKSSLNREGWGGSLVGVGLWLGYGSRKVVGKKALPTTNNTLKHSALYQR